MELAGVSMGSLPSLQVFFKAGAAPLPEKLEMEEIKKAIDNKELLEALSNEEAFDRLFLGLTVRSQEAYRRAKRFKSVDRLTRELANFHFKRKRWGEAEPILRKVLTMYMDRGWNELAYYILIMLAHCQSTLALHAELVDTCLYLLSDRITLQADERAKFADQLLDCARKIKQATVPLVKSIGPSVVSMAVSVPEGQRELFVGDAPCLLCVIRNSLHEITADRVCARLTLWDDAPAASADRSIELCYQPSEGAPFVVVPMGESSVPLVGVARTAGTWRCDKVWLEISGLCLSQAVDAMALPALRIKALQSTLSFEARFPKWLPVDPHQVRFPITLAIQTNSDEVESASLRLGPGQLKPTEGTILRCAGKDVALCADSTVALSAIKAGEEVEVKLPVQLAQTACTQTIALELTYNTSLGGSYRIERMEKIDFGPPFAVTSWQAPFGGGGQAMIAVQVTVKCTARIPLHVTGCRLVPPQGSKAGNVRPLIDGYFGEAVLHPDHELAIAFVVERSPGSVETWNFSTAYEFSLPDGTTAKRTFEALAVVGATRPTYSIEVVAPASGIIGRTCEVSVTIRRCAPAVAEGESSTEMASPQPTQLQVKTARGHPKLWVVSGFRRRTVALPKTPESAAVELKVGIVPLQAGLLPLPAFQLTGRACRESTVSLSPSHVTVLPECRNFFSCKRDTGEKSSGSGAGDDVQASDITIAWIEDKVTTAAAATQYLADTVKKLEGQLVVSIKSFTSHRAFVAWLEDGGGMAAAVAGKLRVVTNRFRRDDGEDVAAHRVVLYLRQLPELAEVPVMVFCGEVAKVDELARLPHVRVSRDFREVADWATAVRQAPEENAGAVDAAFSGAAEAEVNAEVAAAVAALEHETSLLLSPKPTAPAPMPPQLLALQRPQQQPL